MIERSTTARFVLSARDATLSLAIPEYQFPDRPNDDWLLVDLELRYRADSFARRDPSIEAAELEPLVRLLREGAKHADALVEWRGPRLVSRVSFTEPNLAFELAASSGALALRVYFALESLPGFAETMPHVSWPADDEHDAPRVSEAWLDFPVTSARLVELADVVDDWRASFPSRASR